MKIVFIHYVIGDVGGVNTVIYNNARSILKMVPTARVVFLGAIKNKFSRLPRRARYVDVPELDITESRKKRISEEGIFEYMNQGEKIYIKLSRYLEDADVVIIENPNIGIHPAATYAFYRLVKRNSIEKRKMKIIFRIHDFAEDRRENFLNLLKFRGVESSLYWHKVMFPDKRNCSYIVINQADIKTLKSHGLIKEGKIHYIPNPIDDEKLPNGRRANELKNKIIEKYNLKEDIGFIYYPVRIVSRKNIEEAIFLTCIINYHLNKDYYLVVSLKTKEEESYYRKLKRFVEKNNLPVILGIEDMVGIRRVFKNNKLVKYGVGDAYRMSDKVITTSILEGFGLVFIESWFFDKCLIGRDIQDKTRGFKANGINLEHLYTALFIDGKDFTTYNLPQKLRFIRKLKNTKFREMFIKDNLHQLQGMFRLFNEGYEKKLIKVNRRHVIKNYNSKKIAREILKAIRETE